MKQAVITGIVGKLVKEKDMLLSFEFNIEEKQTIIINIYCYNQKSKQKFIDTFRKELNIKLLVIGEVIVTAYHSLEILVEQFRFCNEKVNNQEVVIVTDEEDYKIELLDVTNNEEVEYYVKEAFEAMRKEMIEEF